MAIRTVVTRGYGNGTFNGTIADVVRRGYVAAVAAATVTLTGTVIDATPTEAAVVAGGQTIILTLANDTFVDAGAAFNAIRQDIIDGMDAALSPALGWNDEVRDKEVVGAVVRDSPTQVTITLSAAAAYDITVAETITVTVPASALTGGVAVVATPTFDVTVVAVAAADTVDAGRDSGGARRWIDPFEVYGKKIEPPVPLRAELEIARKELRAIKTLVPDDRAEIRRLGGLVGSLSRQISRVEKQIEVATAVAQVEKVYRATGRKVDSLRAQIREANEKIETRRARIAQDDEDVMAVVDRLLEEERQQVWQQIWTTSFLR